MDGGEERGPRRRLTQARRERFLAVLAQTGNRRMAAEAIGFEPRSMDQRRRYDGLLDRQWSDAVAQADRRLAGIEGPYDESAGEAPMVVKRGPGGRLQLQRTGEKRWSRAVEDRFFATLAVCGNIAASARAVGFSQSCIDQRRRKWPDFARRLEEALDDAEVEIEFRVAAEVRGLRGLRGDGHISPSGDRSGTAARESDCPQPLDMDAAMRFLKWREEKRRGGGRRGRVPAPPSIDEVTERIVRRVKAIRRHRARGGRPPGAEE
ncbi:MAG TPA: hypothetical protein VFZ91_15735 [Allosphingosinicella sp.]